MRKLLRTPGIRLFDAVQADGYARRFRDRKSWSCRWVRSTSA